MELEKTEEKIDKHLYWGKHLEQWRGSGLSQAEYCRRHGLKWFQLHYWKKKLGQEAFKGKLRLVPLKVTGSRETRPKVGESGLRLSVNGLTIEIEDHFNAGTLQRVIETVRAI